MSLPVLEKQARQKIKLAQAHHELLQESVLTTIPQGAQSSVQLSSQSNSRMTSSRREKSVAAIQNSAEPKKFTLAKLGSSLIELAHPGASPTDRAIQLRKAQRDQKVSFHLSRHGY